MNQLKRYRWGKSGALTAALALLACGSTKSLGADTSAGGKPGPDIQGGKSTPPSDGGVGDAASVPVTIGGAGVAESGGAPGAGAPGAGGAAGGDGPGGITNPAYSFQVVAGVAPARFDRGMMQQFVGLRGNADGSFFVGSASWSAFVDATSSYEYGESAIVWTPTGGTLALPMSSLAAGGSLAAANGRTVFGPGVGDVPELVRWTPENGAESFAVPATYRAGPLHVGQVSPDGTVALLLASETPVKPAHLLWREHAAGDKFALLPFQGAYYLSDDGAFVFAEQRTFSTGVTHLYRFDVAAATLQPEEIKQPVGYSDCRIGQFAGNPTTVSPDGSVVVGTCGGRAGLPVMFGWKAGDAAMSLVADGPPLPQRMSADGSNVLGTATPGEHVVDGAVGTGMTWWTSAGSVRTSEGGSVWGLTPDKSAAWISATIGDEYGVPMRWTRAGGTVRLAGAVGALGSELYAVSADGSLAVGISQLPPGAGRAQNRFHTVLWDAQGVRDVTQELLDAGFDQLGVPSQPLSDRLVPDRVWSGASIRIQGHNDGSPEEVWFATVPAR